MHVNNCSQCKVIAVIYFHWMPMRKYHSFRTWTNYNNNTQKKKKKKQEDMNREMRRPIFLCPFDSTRTVSHLFDHIWFVANSVQSHSSPYTNIIRHHDNLNSFALLINEIKANLWKRWSNVSVFGLVFIMCNVYRYGETKWANRQMLKTHAVSKDNTRNRANVR